MRPLPVEVHEPSASPLDLAQRFLSPVVNPLATAGASSSWSRSSSCFSAATCATG
ncbi:MAG: hypothetical protein WDN30_01790 [Pararobbsia sp.]